MLAQVQLMMQVLVRVVRVHLMLMEMEVMMMPNDKGYVQVRRLLGRSHRAGEAASGCSKAPASHWREWRLKIQMTTFSVETYERSSQTTSRTTLTIRSIFISHQGSLPRSSMSIAGGARGTGTASSVHPRGGRRFGV